MEFEIHWDPKDKFNILGVTTKYGPTLYQELPAIVRKAVDVATEAHRGSYRKDQVTPYIVHPWCVLKICIDCEWHFTDEELAAVVLHDVVEDTQWPYPRLVDVQISVRTAQFKALLDIFGPETTSIVWLLTKPEGEAFRRQIYTVSLRRVSPSVIAGKLADALHNLSDLPAGLIREEHVCPECQGRPRTGGGGESCRACGGSGRIRIMFDEYWREKIKSDILPLISILRMHGPMWQSVANWFETRMMRLL